MADKTIGSVLYSTDGSRLDYDTAANLDATFRDVSAETAAVRAELGARITDVAAESEARDDTLYEQVQQVRAEARRPQYADNGDGTGTLLLSSTITDNGDGTGTIGA